MIFRREARNNSNNIKVTAGRGFSRFVFFTFLLQDCVAIFLDFCGNGVL